MRVMAAGLFVASILTTMSFTSAQPPGGKGGEPGKGGQPGGKGGQPGGKGEPGGKGGFPGGLGGKGGGFGIPTPGQVLAPFVQEQLKLTDTQKKELEAIQKDVDAKIEKLLTDDQKKAFKAMKERGPGGFGGGGGGFPGGPGGAGGPGGPKGNPPPKPE